MGRNSAIETIHFPLAEKTLMIKVKRQAYRRSIKLQHQSAEFSITVPFGISLEQINEFLQSQKKWMSKRLINHQKKDILPELPFSEDTKRAAKVLVMSLIEQYQSLYPYTFKRITIKDLHSKWGSCSAQKNLNFNYRIIALPSELAEYLVVHELCHLAELNHSIRFWRLVAKAFPNYQTLRKKLHNIDFKKISS